MKLSNFRFAFLLPQIFLVSLLFLNQTIAGNLNKAFFAYSLDQSSNADHLTSGFYLVIGVFEYEKNARRMVANANQEGLSAEYKLYPMNGYFYVYTSSGEEKTQLLQDYTRVRDSTCFNDAWLLRVREEGDEGTIGMAPEVPLMGESVDGSPILTDDSSTIEKAYVPESEEEQLPKNPVEKEMILVVRTVDHQDGKLIDAKIELVDGLRARLIKKTDAGTPWLVENKEELDTVQVISEALGYRKMQLEFIPNNPFNDTTALYTHIENDTVYMQMNLLELQEGDFQIMYNTYFYGNSTVMRDQSKYELEKLYDIMSSKPNMRIRLHGHTNGNSRGVAYLFKEEGKNYFDIRRTKEYTKRGVSSKRLSAYRAETIKSYLTNNGIDGERIETQGWGGKRWLYETDSPLAKNNIRVEIEVLSK